MYFNFRLSEGIFGMHRRRSKTPCFILKYIMVVKHKYGYQKITGPSKLPVKLTMVKERFDLPIN